MQSAWFGGIVMLLMVAGLGIWLWWVMRQNKEK
jgi:hypothetical protein